MRQKVNFILICFVRFYQKYLSFLTTGACRYYPSCSQYAIWLLHFDNPFLAICKSCARILRCNQYFSGGISYPQVSIHIRGVIFMPKKITYWFVPIKNTKFLGIIPVLYKTYSVKVYIIKSLF